MGFADRPFQTINIIPTAARDIWSKVGADPSDGSIDCGQAGVASDIVFVLGSQAHYTIPSSMSVAFLLAATSVF